MSKNVYWYCYATVEGHGINIGVVDRILLNFNREAGLFHSILYTKLFALLLMDSLIPASKISSLTQGMFVGAVSDNFDERIDQKIFHAEIVVDNAKVARETKAYKPIPIITDFTDENGNDHMEETVAANYFRIKEDVKQIVSEELERIRNNPTLAHLLQQK